MNKKISTSKLIEKNVNFLNSVCESKKSRKIMNEILLNASAEQLLCFVEICFNLLKGRLPFHRNRINNLQKHANILRKISRSRSASSTRCLLQQGNGIYPLAGILASLVLPLITDKIFK